MPVVITLAHGLPLDLSHPSPRPSSAPVARDQAQTDIPQAHAQIAPARESEQRAHGSTSDADERRALEKALRVMIKKQYELTFDLMDRICGPE